MAPTTDPNAHGGVITRSSWLACFVCACVAVVSLGSSCGECVCACIDDDDCGEDQFCSWSGGCYDGSGSACGADADCPGSEVCSSDDGFCFLDFPR